MTTHTISHMGELLDSLVAQVDAAILRACDDPNHAAFLGKVEALNEVRKMLTATQRSLA